MTHMMEALTPHVMANTARMLRSGNPGTSICIVEGDDDKKLFKELLDISRCRILVANGWEMAVAILGILEGAGFPGILAIIDADFRRFENAEPSSPNLFWTDYHDIEIDLVHSPAFERVVGELCDMEKHPHPPPGELRDRVLRATAPLAYLRLHSARSGLNLTFTELPYSAFISKETLVVDEVEMVRAVKNKSQRHDLKDSDLVASAKALSDPNHDLKLLCRGHDVTAIFSLGLRKVFSRHNPPDVTPVRLEMLLRAAYNILYFATTALFAALRRWQERNNPFTVLQPS
jgi:hypothetical protein